MHNPTGYDKFRKLVSFLLFKIPLQMNDKNLKELHSKAFAHKSCDKDWKFLTYVALNWLERNNITPEEKNEALKEFETLKQEKIEKIEKWNLVFVGMWTTNDMELWNYRFRTNILRNDWKRFFVELSSHNWKVFIDHSIDLDEKAYFSRMFDFYNSKWYANLSKEERKERAKRSKQPYERYKIDQARDFLDWKPATKQLVIDFVNFIFDTNFNRMEIENYLLTTDDYISID